MQSTAFGRGMVARQTASPVKLGLRHVVENHLADGGADAVAADHEVVGRASAVGEHDLDALGPLIERRTVRPSVIEAPSVSAARMSTSCSAGRPMATVAG